jgi:hypothetical protein
VTSGDETDRSGEAGPDVDQQIRVLTDIIDTLARALSRLSGRVDRLAARSPDATDEEGDEPAAWVWLSPPTADTDDPQVVVDNFVAFYNLAYVGIEGSRATPIPPCWRQHPGLTMEVANLAYTWRASNLGASANVRDAQQWHHQWRPAFAERLVREWVHTDCLDGDHRSPSDGDAGICP